MRGAFINLIAGLLGIASILWWRSLEEEKLIAEYLEEYKEYRKSTWF
jgi:protein-S-isoprenylcysteine O-methyltransferase Ste14